MSRHIIRIIMALIGIGLMAAIGCGAESGAAGGMIIIYALYGIFYMCTYPSIGRYYGVISLWSSIPGVSIAGWVALTLILIALSVVVIPLSLVWHVCGAVKSMLS